MKTRCTILLLCLSMAMKAQQLTSLEYFYDTDPGYGNGTLLTLNNTVSLDSVFNFPVNGLTQGVHTIFIRLKNSDNNWSHTIYEGNFFVWTGISGTAQIQMLNYFIDSTSNSTPVALNLQASLDTTVSIHIPDNGASLRKLGLRMKNQTGQLGNATLTDINLCDLYKPFGGFRTIQYGSTFTLIDTSKYNTSNKIRWLVNNVLFDSSYTTNYSFPTNFIGSKTIKQLIGTGCRVDTATRTLNMPGVENYAPVTGSYNSDFELNIYGGGLDTSLNIFLQRGTTKVYPYLKISKDGNQHLIAVFDFHGFSKTFGYPEIKEDYILHVVYPGGYESALDPAIYFEKQEDNTTLRCIGLPLLNGQCQGGQQFTIRVQDPDYQSPDSTIEPFFATDLTGPNQIRAGVWNNFTMSITNTGTIAAKGIPFYIMLPAYFDIDTTKWNSMYDPIPGLRDSISVITNIDTIVNGRHLQYKLIAMIYPVLTAGETGYFPLRIRTIVDSSFHIFYTVQSRMFGSPMTYFFGPCWGAVFDFAIGFIPGVSCLYAFGNLINDQVNFGLSTKETTRSDWYSLGLSYAGTAVSCIPGGGPLAQIAKASSKEMGFVKAGLGSVEDAVNIADKGLNTLSNVNSAANSNDPCVAVKQKPKKKDEKSVLSVDPNYITGNNDYDTVMHYINNYSPQQYTIGFENRPTATANAQHVYITDTLSNQKFIFQSLKFSEFSIGDSAYSTPSFRTQVTKDVKLKNRNDMKVRFVSSFDTAKGIIQTDFFSIDTMGHVLPLDSLDGFLPPDLDGVSGTGSISYSIYAQNLNTLDTFSNKASIYFDNNQPIITNTWKNTLDTTRPQGHIANAIIINDSTAKLIMQGSSDIGSGISYHTFYVKKGNDSLFRETGEAVGDTIIFKGQPGLTYRIFSKATDNVGNRQKKDSVADITITFANSLPLSWLSFTGKMMGEKVQLNWITANEMNTSHFDVEKSADGIHFSKIGNVAALGNTGQNNQYIFFDEHPFTGNNYYRLKQFDIDGKTAYSTVVKIYYGTNGFVSIAPNPAKELVEIRSSEILTRIQLIDMNGKLVKTFVPSATNTYSLTNISRGMYLLRLFSDRDIQTHKLMIAK